MLTDDGRQTDEGYLHILQAHRYAFDSGELKMKVVIAIRVYINILICPTYPEKLYVSTVMKNPFVGYEYAK